MLSVTEGDDKPLKYRHMFRAADIVIITKSDLLPHVDFSIDRCLGNVRAVNRSIRSLVLSATTGEGVGAWYDWLNAEQCRRRAGIGIADPRTFPIRASNPIVIVPGFA